MTITRCQRCGGDHLNIDCPTRPAPPSDNLSDYHAAKRDAGKPRVGLMLADFSNALRSVAEVSTFGAQKYAPSSWLTVPDAEERYWDAVGRHLLAAQGVDEESGLPHLAHAAWGLLALLELRSRKP